MNRHRHGRVNTAPLSELARGLSCAVLLVVLGACAHQASNTDELQQAIDRASNLSEVAAHPETEFPDEQIAAQSGQNLPSSALEQGKEVSLGTGTFTGPSPRAPVSRPSSGEDDFVLNFQGVDIHEVVKAVLGEMLGQNYIIEQGVTGTVTTETSGGLEKSDLLAVLEMLLRQNQAALIKEGDLYRIVPIATSIKGGVGPQRSNDPSYGLQIVTLRYIAVNEMKKIMEPILVEGALVSADEKRNLLVLAGTSAEQRRYLETIAVFDVDWMKGMSIGLFSLKFVEPEQLKKELEQALGGEDNKVLDGLVRLVALDRLRALLAVSPSQRAIAEIKAWTTRLDVPSDTAEPRLFVFRLQNAKAVDVAAILNDVFSGIDSSRSRARDVELAPGLQPTSLESEGYTPPTSFGSPAVDGVAFSIGGNVRIIPDETNNGLVILATPKEYALLASAIEKLDLVPLQVLIEATIVEVTLADSLEYGVEWFFKNNLASNKTGQGLLDIGAPGIATLAPSFSYAILDSAGQVRAAINALATESRVSILSSPSLMVLDNQTATINVGDEIPIPTRSSVSNVDPNAPTVNEIEYRNTGVTLQVTPRVNAGGLVTMEVDQEVSDAVGTTSSDLNAPTIQQRKITSTVAVQSGETIVLGGLIRDSAIDGESGLPYIRNIPIIGKFFGQTNDSTRRTELIVLITPRAVSNDAQARDVTREYSEKMKSMREPEHFELSY